MKIVLKKKVVPCMLAVLNIAYTKYGFTAPPKDDDYESKAVSRSSSAAPSHSKQNSTFQGKKNDDGIYQPVNFGAFFGLQKEGGVDVGAFYVWITDKGVLAWRESEAKSDPIGTLDLPSVTSVKLGVENEKTGASLDEEQKSKHFTLFYPTGCYVFQGESMVVRDEWVRAIRYCLRNLRELGTVSRPLSDPVRGNIVMAGMNDRIEDLEAEKKLADQREEEWKKKEEEYKKRLAEDDKRKQDVIELLGKMASAEARNKELERKLEEYKNGNVQPLPKSRHPSSADQLATPKTRSKRSNTQDSIDSEDGFDTIETGTPGGADPEMYTVTEEEQEMIDEDIRQQKLLALELAKETMPEDERKTLEVANEAEEEVKRADLIKKEKEREKQEAEKKAKESESKMKKLLEGLGEKSSTSLDKLNFESLAAKSADKDKVLSELNAAKAAIDDANKNKTAAQQAVKDADRELRDKTRALDQAKQDAKDREEQFLLESQASLPDPEQGREFFCMTTAAVLQKLEDQGVIEDSRKMTWAFDLFDIAILEGIPFHEWNDWILERVLMTKRKKDQERQEQLLRETRQKELQAQRINEMTAQIQNKRNTIYANSGLAPLQAAQQSKPSFAFGGSSLGSSQPKSALVRPSIVVPTSILPPARSNFNAQPASPSAGAPNTAGGAEGNKQDCIIC